MTFVLIAVTMALVVRSLWIRRDTWRSRWEIGASLSVALQGCALLLMSPWAANILGQHLHRALGRWNVQHLLGHICLIVAVTALIRHVLIRFTNQPQVTTLFSRQVLRPVRLGVPLLAVLFVAADERDHPDLLTAHVGNAWLSAYWLLLGALLLYLLNYAARVLLIIRGDARSRPVVNVYLLALGSAVVAGVLRLGSVWAGIDITLLVWLFTCLSLGGFACGSAQSWQAKINWFVAASHAPSRSLRV